MFKSRPPFFFFLIELTFIEMRVSKYWLTVFSTLNHVNALNSAAEKSGLDPTPPASTSERAPSEDSWALRLPQNFRRNSVRPSQVARRHAPGPPGADAGMASGLVHADRLCGSPCAFCSLSRWRNSKAGALAGDSEPPFSAHITIGS